MAQKQVFLGHILQSLQAPRSRRGASPEPPYNNFTVMNFNYQ